MKSEMKRFSLIKTKYGERKGQELTYFFAPSIDDHMLLVNVKTYLHVYLSALTAMTFDEITKALEEFDGSISNDNYVIELTENQ